MPQNSPSPLFQQLYLSQNSGAILSVDRKHRYALWRKWDENKPYVLFIGLNPSKADENNDDPTLRRCIGFAKAWGYGGVCMANLFSLRATDPRDMKNSPYPVRKENQKYLQQLANNAGLIICAWGTHGSYLDADKQFMKHLKAYSLKCLGITKEGHPKHPLYIKSDQQPISFS